MILSKKEMGLLIKKAREKKSQKLRKKYTQTMLAKDLELILSKPGLTLNGELLLEESKIALSNAIDMGLAYAEKLQNLHPWGAC